MPVPHRIASRLSVERASSSRTENRLCRAMNSRFSATITCSITLSTANCSRLLDAFVEEVAKTIIRSRAPSTRNLSQTTSAASLASIVSSSHITVTILINSSAPTNWAAGDSFASFSIAAVTSLFSRTASSTPVVAHGGVLGGWGEPDWAGWLPIASNRTASSASLRLLPLLTTPTPTVDTPLSLRQFFNMSDDEIASRWPLHWQIWHDDPQSLKRILSEKLYDKEEKDPRGRTPLHLAVTLRRTNCVGVLLSFGANTLAVNRHQWSVLHEAVSTAHPELIGMVLCCRDRQQLQQRDTLIPELLQRLVNGPDFYIEMKWEFTSWIPFMSRLTPSDTYRIWKKGAAVRVDTTLIGFQNLQWLRGRQSMMFSATAEGATMMQIDHDKQTVWKEHFNIQGNEHNPQMVDQAMGVARRLSSPLVSTIIDTDSIAFQRQKSGIWGFRSDRTENVNGFDAKVFSATGLNMVSRTRVEHLSESERKQCKDSGYNPLQGLLGTEEDQNEGRQIEPPPGATSHMLTAGTVSETLNSSSQQLTIEEYFTAPSNPKEYDGIGREVEVHSRVQQLKASVWLAEGYPLSLQEQILPVIELMSISDAHFAKVKDFIALQMPAGFPVKFEIPIFHVMSARVTFGNIGGCSEPVPHVALHTEEEEEEKAEVFSRGATSPQLSDGLVMRRTSSSSENTQSDTVSDLADHETSVAPTGLHMGRRKKREVCQISEEAFTIPAGYRQLNKWSGTMADQDEEMLQLAIRQSLMDQRGGTTAHEEENVTMTMTEALNDPSIITSSLSVAHGGTQEESDFELALALSQAMAAENNSKREEEDEELQRVLRLSLEDK